MALRPPRPASGFVSIWSDTDEVVTAIQTEEPDGTLGGVVWDDLERPGLESIGHAKSQSSDTVTVKLRLQVGKGTDDVRASLDVLRRMARRADGVFVIGELPIRPNQRMRIDGGITLGKRRYERGSRTRLHYQEFALTLTSLNRTRTVAQAVPKRSRDTNGKRRVRTIRTRTGDTLRRLAIAELGNAARWREIREWNPKFARTDPDARLRTGTKVLIR